MIKRAYIRYGNLWVRIVCCLWVAVAVGNVVYFDAIAPLERLATSLLYTGVADPIEAISQTMELITVLCLCFVISIPRIERPWSMVAWGVVLAVLYTMAAFSITVNTSVVMPVASPLLGLLGSAGMLQTMAWTEERTRRRRLELLEIAKQQFTDMLVHDLRRRISSILMSFSLLEERTGTGDSKLVEIQDTIRATAERVLTEVSDLLDIRKIEEGKMVLHRENLMLRSLLTECVDEQRPVRDLLDLEIILKDESDVAVNVDPGVFRRIISNLFWNSVQHAPTGSRIEVGYENAEDGSVSLYVANRGKPIPQEQQELMFQAFVSSRSELVEASSPVSGLGLAFCRLAVEAHGGSIFIESPWKKQGDGVKVVVNLSSI